MTTDLTKQQSAIVSFLLENLQICDPMQTLQFSLSDSRAAERQTVAYSTISDVDEKMSAIFTISDISDRMFFTVSDGDPIEIAQILGTLEEYDCYSAELHVGSTVEMPGEYLKQHDKVGLVILSAATSLLFRHLGKSIQVGEKTYSPLLVAFINGKELEIKKNLGFGDLMDYFEETDKDLIAID